MDVVGFILDEKSFIYLFFFVVLNLGNVIFEEGEDYGEVYDFVIFLNEECKLCLYGYYLVFILVSLNV